ncbi:2'-5' RNA ligase family protein [Atopomonas sediminilitoris]|uniref:2'-5' RNA ligase family protein n=1 Tax=Atopomonas sediminilitoris TaxID=2919919 RepID=UPI001F4E8057|nr:2'-5' RNA ligase family protein [Atopomonas sediminilitoris]MCJ8170031.1 2'-5' RNA ligase family protein [Atopomonas sediminilitoris]
MLERTDCLHWQRRLVEGQVTPWRPQPTAAWHQGRRWFAVWALVPREPAVAAYLARLQAGLAPWLAPHYRRQAHVTLAVAGFPARCAHHADERSWAQLRQQMQQLKRLNNAPVLCRTRHLSSFAHAPFVAVEVPEVVSQWRTQLKAQHSEAAHQFRFTPHLTLGVYRYRLPIAALERRLQALDSQAPLSFMTDLALMGYRPGQFCGPLTRLV